MRFCVVGHVEWVTFARVPEVVRPGQIVHAKESWAEAAGGGAMAAIELQRLAGQVDFFTAIGDDEIARRAQASLEDRGITIHADVRSQPHPRVVTFIDDAGERAITVLQPPLAPHGQDWAALDGADAVYFCKGDAAAAKQARRARLLVATARAKEILRGVRVDVLVLSALDAGEAYAPGELDPPPQLVVSTEGAAGGSYETADGKRGRWEAVPAKIVDSYGAGDSFAAALTFALGEGRSLDDALAFAAERGALQLGRRGAG